MRLAPILLALVCALAPPPTSALAQTTEERGPVAALPSAAAGAACSRDLRQPDDIEASEDYSRQASSKNPCAVADENLSREEAEILKSKPAAAAAPSLAWDHKSRPQFLEAITRRFALQPAELAVINRAGLAVPARLEVASYTRAYH